MICLNNNNNKKNILIFILLIIILKLALNNFDDWNWKLLQQVGSEMFNPPKQQGSESSSFPPQNQLGIQPVKQEGSVDE